MVDVPRHIISARQFSDTDFLNDFFAHVAQRKDDYLHLRRPQTLEGLGIILLFNEPSTRTRVSFSMAAQLLGAAVENVIGESHTSFSKGESYEDALRVLARYADALIIRSKMPEVMRLAAKVCHIPVINAGDGGNEHPTQALLDLFTMYEVRKKFDGLRVAFCGDLKYGRTVHSNLILLNNFSDMTFVQAAPKELRIPDTYAEEILQKGNRIEIAASLKEAVRDVDVVYMTRVQKERLLSPDEYSGETRALYTMTPEVMSHLPEHSIVMHPLPRDSSEGKSEIDPAVDDDPRSKYFEQVRNGVPTRMALLEFCLRKFRPDYPWSV